MNNQFTPAFDSIDDLITPTEQEYETASIQSSFTSQSSSIHHHQSSIITKHSYLAFIEQEREYSSQLNQELLYEKDYCSRVLSALEAEKQYSAGIIKDLQLEKEYSSQLHQLLQQEKRNCVDLKLKLQNIVKERDFLLEEMSSSMELQERMSIYINNIKNAQTAIVKGLNSGNIVLESVAEAYKYFQEAKELLDEIKE